MLALRPINRYPVHSVAQLRVAAVCCAVSFVAVVCTAAASGSVQVSAPLSPPGESMAEGWHPAGPGFPAQVLLSRGESMWAAGSAESIAVSNDLGQHWEIKHREANGALLLTMNFIGEQFGYAAGTLGKVLFTQDGGETWTGNSVADETILQAAFGDNQHGVVRTLSALLSTPNGGISWNPVVPVNEPDWVSKFPFTVGMAALDKDHLVVRVSAGPGRDGEYLWSIDGGATWSANYIGNSAISSLFVAAGAYWSIGHSVLAHQKNRRDKYGFGYSAPMAFHSRNGIVWEHNPLNWDACHWYDCGGCTPQGCFGGRSSLLELREGTDKLDQDSMDKFPAHDGLSSEWAKMGDTLCMLVHSGVQCANLQSVRQLDILDDAPSWQDRSVPAIGRVTKSDPQCIRCPLDPIYVSATDHSGPTDLDIFLTIKPSGEVDQVAVQGEISEDLESKIHRQVQTWIFEPHMDNGIPTGTTLDYPANILLLNPAQTASAADPARPANGLSPVIVLNPQQ